MLFFKKNEKVGSKWPKRKCYESYIQLSTFRLVGLRRKKAKFNVVGFFFAKAGSSAIQIKMPVALLQAYKHK